MESEPNHIEHVEEGRKGRIKGYGRPFVPSTLAYSQSRTAHGTLDGVSQYTFFLSIERSLFEKNQGAIREKFKGMKQLVFSVFGWSLHHFGP